MPYRREESRRQAPSRSRARKVIKIPELDEFQFSSMKRDAIVALLAPRRAGKSVFTRRLMLELNMSKVIAFVGSCDAYDNALKWCPPCYVNLADEWTEDFDALFQSVYDTQVKLAELRRKYDKTMDIETAALLDDLAENKEFMNGKLMKRITVKGRHAKLLLIVCCQYYTQMHPETRGNLDYYFILKTTKPKAIKALFDDVLSTYVETLAEAKAIIKHYTKKYGVLVVDTTGNSSELQDCLKKVTAIPDDILPNIIVGSPIYQQQCKLICEHREKLQKEQAARQAQGIATPGELSVEQRNQLIMDQLRSGYGTSPAGATASKFQYEQDDDDKPVILEPAEQKADPSRTLKNVMDRYNARKDGSALTGLDKLIQEHPEHRAAIYQHLNIRPQVSGPPPGAPGGPGPHAAHRFAELSKFAVPITSATQHQMYPMAGPSGHPMPGHTGMVSGPTTPFHHQQTPTMMGPGMSPFHQQQQHIHAIHGQTQAKTASDAPKDKAHTHKHTKTVEDPSQKSILPANYVHMKLKGMMQPLPKDQRTGKEDKTKAKGKGKGEPEEETKKVKGTKTKTTKKTKAKTKTISSEDDSGDESFELGSEDSDYDSEDDEDYVPEVERRKTGKVASKKPSKTDKTSKGKVSRKPKPNPGRKPTSYTSEKQQPIAATAYSDMYSAYQQYVSGSYGAYPAYYGGVMPSASTAVACY